MGIADVLWQVTTVVGAMLAVATAGFVGLRPVGRALQPAALRRRLDAVAPYLVCLLVVLGFRRLALQYGPGISWLLDVNATSFIYALEGTFVAELQSVRSPTVTRAMTYSYLYVYTFLLVFPFVAYLALEDVTHLRELVVAALLNYGIGLLCYVLVVAYGPRNVIFDVAPPLLYDTYPQSQLLTSEVNRNVNVFPSLHTSLSVTVAAMAFRTRDHYPLWAPVAAVLAASVVFSTMYLAIHWATDVVGGVVLAGIAYWGARHAPATTGSDLWDRFGGGR